MRSVFGMTWLGRKKMGEFWTENSTASLENFIRQSEVLYDKHKYVRFSWKTGRQRTDTQNAAIHVFCRLIAEALNDAGYEMVIESKALSSTVEVPWTQDSVKDLIWRKVQMTKYPAKESTVKLERTEVSEVADTITKFLGEKFGLQVIFPSNEANAI